MENKRKLHGKLENFIKIIVYLNYTHFSVARLTGLRLSGQLVIYIYTSGPSRLRTGAIFF